jgi:hypothetical protein
MIKYSFNLMFHSDGSFEILAQKGDLTLDERSRFELLKKALTKICTPPKQLELISKNEPHEHTGKRIREYPLGLHNQGEV